MTRSWIIQNRRPLIFVLVAFVHLAALIFFRIAVPTKNIETAYEDYEVLKLVDIEEYVPPPPPEVPVTMAYNQPSAAERVIESETLVVESKESGPAEGEYLPQHKVSSVPEIPTADILARIEYPPIALRQGIEAVVYLELFIDQTGRIRRVEVLKDPGHGFAESAVASLKDIRCRPALANGSPVAVRFRYPIRFTLH